MTSSSQTLPDVGDGSRLYQQLARRLLADLAGGRYAVGDRLPPERELAIEHDVSRPTVREAIRQLETDGLVVHLPRQGATIRSLDHAEVVELYEMRAVLEGTAARLAARAASDVERAELAALNADLAAAPAGPLAAFSRVRRYVGRSPGLRRFQSPAIAFRAR